MLEYLIAPNRTAIEFQDAFEALRGEAWYLHRKDNDTFYFSNIENHRKPSKTHKDVYVYPLVRDARQQLSEDLTR
jgi:hypothetical protein